MIFLPCGKGLPAQFVDFLSYEKVAGAEVRVGVRSVVVRVEVEQAIVAVRVVVTADIGRTLRAVRVRVSSA